MVDAALRARGGRLDMRDIIRHRGGVVPLIAASVVFALWNTAYKFAVSGLPVMTVLPVMLLTAAAALWGCALARGRQRLTRGQLRRPVGSARARRRGLRRAQQRAHRPRAR